MDGELAILAGRVDVLIERVRTARSIAARRFALDALARGLMLADPGTVTDPQREAARSLRVDPSTVAASAVGRLPHAVAVPLVDRARAQAFVRQVHVTYDPAGLVGDGLLGPTARHAAAEAIRSAAARVAAPREPGAHVLVAAQPEVLRAARVEGRSLGAAAVVSAVSLWTGRAVRPDRVVTGALGGDAILGVGEIEAKVRGARAHGASAIVVPAADAAAARAAAADLEVVAVARISELLDEALEPSGATADAETLAAQARELARAGWVGYRWPSLRAQLARISGTLPERRVDLRVEVLTRLAAAHRHSGDPIGCLELLGEAVAIVRSDEGRRAVPDGPIVDLWIQTAMTERQLCRFGPAARAAARSVAVARRARLRGRLIKALGTAGLVAMSRGRIPAAIAAFEESLDHTLAHQPNATARSRAYLLEALGEAGRPGEVDAQLGLALDEAAEPSRGSWVRTSGAGALLALGRPADAAALLDAPEVRASLLDEPLPGLLARRRLGVALARSGEPGRAFEVLAASPLVHGRALAPHLSFLAHVNVLHEARERLRADAWDADVAGRAGEALRHLPTYGEVPRFLGRPLAITARMLARGGRPRGIRGLEALLERCARLT